MEVFKILVGLQALVLCQGKLYIHQVSTPCSWAITSAGENQSLAIFTKQSILPLATRICQALGCGEVYKLNENTAHKNASCLTGCSYHNNQLINCTKVHSIDCSILSGVVCGSHKVRLSGGSHKCAGRVELWNAGQWGTVCDDEWDKKDADVVCAQLNCGYAISVNGQDGPYTQGKGPILMDELNCTGLERSLWECPAVREGHDCGHKEDAGVVCSEYKALRLTGGLDHCSGRVEIHRNGLWGTVCDECWDELEASMACSMLGCGTAKKFTDFEIPFPYTNGSHWYYFCKGGHKTLWECKEIETSKFSHLQQICKDSMAAGVICNKSLGLPVPTTPDVVTMVTMQITTNAPAVIWTPELLGCIILSCILLIAVLLNIMCCFFSKKKIKVDSFPLVYEQTESLRMDNTGV